MSRRLFESPQASFNSIFEPPPFHSNLHYQEVLATLRYGIIARKGLILLIGDAGLGKSTLLHQLMRELDNHVACIFEPNPDVSFSDLLRLVLDNLEIADNSPGRLSMLQRCKAILRSQLETGRVVSLIIDNAERLRHETLEHLLHNFYSATPIDRDENLLQIVLAGRPELKNNLVRTWLRSFKPRAEIICQLQPLQDKDIPAYLDTRLRAANLPQEIFNRAAIDQVAAYTGGNPHLINAISNRALQVSDGSPVTHVTAEMVAYAALSLDLSETSHPVKEPVNQNFEIPNERDERFRLVEGDTTEVFGRIFPHSTFDDRRQPLRSAGRGRKAVRVLLILVLLAGGAAWLQSEAGKSELSNRVGKLSEVVSSHPKPESNADAPPLAQQKVSAAQKPLEIDPEPAQKKALVLAGNSQAPEAGNTDARRKLLEAQVYRAIENRAIIGVTLSVIDGIVYLDGLVATEAQRNIAGQAAQSVDGVDQVHNRIAVAENEPKDIPPDEHQSVATTTTE